MGCLAQDGFSGRVLSKAAQHLVLTLNASGDKILIRDNGSMRCDAVGLPEKVNKSISGLPAVCLALWSWS